MRHWQGSAPTIQNRGRNSFVSRVGSISCCVTRRAAMCRGETEIRIPEPRPWGQGGFPRTAPLPAVCVLSQWIRFCLGNMAQWPPAPLPFSKRLRLPSLATGKPHACWWAQVSRSGLALYWHGREPDTGQALPPLYGTHLASSKAGAGTFSCRILADDWYTFVVESWYKNSVA